MSKAVPEPVAAEVPDMLAEPVVPLTEIEAFDVSPLMLGEELPVLLFAPFAEPVLALFEPEELTEVTTVLLMVPEVGR